MHSRPSSLSNKRSYSDQMISATATLTNSTLLLPRNDYVSPSAYLGATASPQSPHNHINVLRSPRASVPVVESLILSTPAASESGFPSRSSSKNSPTKETKRFCRSKDYTTPQDPTPVETNKSRKIDATAYQPAKNSNIPSVEYLECSPTMKVGLTFPDF